VKLTIDAPDGTRYAERTRIDTETSAQSSPQCIKREAREEVASSTSNANASVWELPCILEAPVVVWGQAVESVEYVCVAQRHPAAMGYPWFVAINPSGLILEAAPAEVSRTTPGQNFSAAGEMLGDPEIQSLHRACSDLTPWASGDMGPSDVVLVEGDLIVRFDAPEEIPGMWVEIDMGSAGKVGYIDGERRGSSMSRFLYYPVAPQLRAWGKFQALDPVPPVPDLVQHWNLVITIRPGAITREGGPVEIDPSKIELSWEL